MSDKGDGEMRGETVSETRVTVLIGQPSRYAWLSAKHQPPAKMCPSCGTIIERGVEIYPDNHWPGCKGGAAVDEWKDPVVLERRDLRILVAAARFHLNSFTPDVKEILPEGFSYQDVSNAVARCAPAGK